MADIHKKLFLELGKLIPSERLFNDELQTFAYGTDASFYRLTPKIVVKVISEDEAIFVIKKCYEFEVPITFRASGTSLSGQSISDSVLLVADRSWNQVKVSSVNPTITLQPAVLGGKANIELAKSNQKIGPDPASINSATVAGIIANNASGMTSGVINNSYNTIEDLRIVFANGSVLNTADGEDKIRFIEENRELIVELLSIAWDINIEPETSERIKNKYKIKNTTGYSINSFVDYKDPIEIIKHLMVGSEGTLGFISQITLKTVPELLFKASSLLLFEDVKAACSIIPILKKLPIDAAEIMDRASLKSVENKQGMPDYIKDLGPKVAALLVETSAENNSELHSQIESIKQSLSIYETVQPIEFTSIPKEYLRLWNIRKGLFPSVSKARPQGTTVIIEDVNFSTDKLADAVEDIQELFTKHGYDDAIIWGHALSGNIHFVFAQDFGKEHEIKRYKKFMQDVVYLVIEKYDGSLKAEHGTGRNMAPFVKYEWGEKIYEYMVRTKNAFDPKGILNPGVLINTDPEVYVKNLKPTPIVNSIIDKCIDCGFCENSCPSKNLTLTPRQRISTWREISSLSPNSKRYKNMLKQFNYYGEATCATDGLCELSCPVDIDTGKLVKELRMNKNSKLTIFISNLISKHFGFTAFILKRILNIVSYAKMIFGDELFGIITRFIRRITFNKIPTWNIYLPKGAKSKFKNSNIDADNQKVVYFPSCISRTMGTYNDSNYKEDQTTVMKRLFSKSGYNVAYPNRMKSLCCGMPFSSKGLFDQANYKAQELYDELNEISENGNLPIVFDTSPCVKTFLKYLENNRLNNLKVYDSVEFISDHILDKVAIKKKKDTIAIHSTCSTTKMELTEKLLKVANECAEKVFVPEDVNCCGFAGDRGFSYPELNKSALQNLNTQVRKNNCSSGYSTSRTCEIGLSLHSCIEYNSIVYLVDECSEAITEAGN